MNIEPELRAQLKNNQRTIFITEADELLAAWQFQRKSSPKRSKNTSMVPTQWRYSVPPGEKSPLMPCHVSYRCKAAHASSSVKPATEYLTSYSTSACCQTYETSPNLKALDVVDYAKRNMAPYVSPILDAVTLGLVAEDLGLSGRAIPKVINGRQYIAFVETTGARVVFPGTLYAARNRKIINMAIGSLGIKNMAVKGGILTICITVPLTILECYLKDTHSLAAFAGTLTSDH